MRKDLTLTPTTESSCSCCSTPTTTAKATTATASTTTPANVSGAVYELEGLTCGGCVQSVEKAVRNVVGVDSATVSLVSGGTSSLAVAGSATPESVRAAVLAAGYAVAPAS